MERYRMCPHTPNYLYMYVSSYPKLPLYVCPHTSKTTQRGIVLSLRTIPLYAVIEVCGHTYRGSLEYEDTHIQRQFRGSLRSDSCPAPHTLLPAASMPTLNASSKPLAPAPPSPVFPSPFPLPSPPPPYYHTVDIDISTVLSVSSNFKSNGVTLNK